MWKKIIIGIVVLIVVVVVAFMLLLDRMAKVGIEKYGSKALGTEVTVSSVSLSPFTGKGTIHNLKVANPEGYDAQYLFQSQSISVGVDLASLLTDTIVIHYVDINKPHIVYETGLDGSNIQAIQDNIAKNKTSSDQSQEAPSTDEGKQLVIESLVISDAKVTGSIGFAGTTASLPTITITDIGRDDGGLSYAQATAIVFGAIIKSLATIDLGTLGEPLGKAAQAIGETAGTIGGHVSDAGESVGDAVGGAVKHVFGGDDDDK